MTNLEQRFFFEISDDLLESQIILKVQRMSLEEDYVVIIQNEVNSLVYTTRRQNGSTTIPSKANVTFPNKIMYKNYKNNQGESIKWYKAKCHDA